MYVMYIIATLHVSEGTFFTTSHLTDINKKPNM